MDCSDATLIAELEKLLSQEVDRLKLKKLRQWETETIRDCGEGVTGSVLRLRSIALARVETPEDLSLIERVTRKLKEHRFVVALVAIVGVIALVAQFIEDITTIVEALTGGSKNEPPAEGS
ncbi:MAG: hypothetical protein AAF916_06940 [Planctomycetota bacterium]